MRADPQEFVADEPAETERDTVFQCPVEEGSCCRVLSAITVRGIEQDVGVDEESQCDLPPLHLFVEPIPVGHVDDGPSHRKGR